MPFKGIQRNALIHHNIAVRNFILFQTECFQLFTGIDIGLVSDGLNDTGNGTSTYTDKIFSALCQRAVIHPQQGCLECLGAGNAAVLCQHTTAGYINLTVQLNGNRLSGRSIFCLFVTDENGFDCGLFPARLYGNGISH